MAIVVEDVMIYRYFSSYMPYQILHIQGIIYFTSQFCMHAVTFNAEVIRKISPSFISLKFVVNCRTKCVTVVGCMHAALNGALTYDLFQNSRP